MLTVIGRVLQAILFLGSVMAAVIEDDFPVGHPKRFDYDPDSPEAKEWARVNIHPKGERDWPVDHPKAVDTPGNQNHVTWEPGVDPAHPELEPFSGRTPKQVEGARALSMAASAKAVDTAPLQPVDGQGIFDALAAECKKLGVTTLTQEQRDAVLRRLTPTQQQ